MAKVILKVEGMSCGHCVQSVEGAIRKAGAEGKVDLPNKTVTVEYEASKISLEAVKEAITEQGYEVV